MNAVELFNKYFNSKLIQNMEDPYYGINCGTEHLICEGNFDFDRNGLFTSSVIGRYKHISVDLTRFGLCEGPHKWRVER